MKKRLFFMLTSLLIISFGSVYAQSREAESNTGAENNGAADSNASLEMQLEEE